jgi:hypothetical protein
MVEESIGPCCDPICDAAGNCAAAVNAAAAAVAVAGGAAGVGALPGDAGLELPVPESEMRFCVSKVLSAAALLWSAAIALLPVEEVLLVGAAGAPGAAAGAGIAAASAPASACSRNASALDAGSAADCLADAWLDAFASGAWDLPAEASVAAVPSGGVAASDWASAAEKSLVSVAAAAAAAVPAVA